VQRKKNIASKHLAYKAWEERKREREKLKVADKGVSKALNASLPEKQPPSFKTRARRSDIPVVSEFSDILVLLMCAEA
jgi:hypothetical protein